MKQEFFEDYKKLMGDVQALKKDADNPFFKSKYVPLKNVLEEAKRVCIKNNFIFVQYPVVTQDGKNTLVTKLTHSSGESFVGQIELVSKDPNDPQKIGAGMTYMRRYSLTSMLGIEEDDDDGNSASGNKIKKAPAQVEL